MDKSKDNNAGEFFEAAVPDTLDLAERAELSVNALTGAISDEHNFEVFQCAHLDQQPPNMNLSWAGPCVGKPIEALPMMRTMSGSKLNIDKEEKMIESVLKDIEEDGLWWQKVEGRPWRGETFKEDQAWPLANGRLMRAFIMRYKYDGNPVWKSIVSKISKGLYNIALSNEDRSWLNSAFTRAGWKKDETPSADIIASEYNDIAVGEPPGTATFNIGLPIHGLSEWYKLSGDEPSIKLADRLANFYLKPSMWPLNEGPGMVAGNEHGHVQAHFHSSTMGVMGLLDYAVVRNNAWLMRFCADFYEYFRNYGISRIGFFPAVANSMDKIKEANKTYGVGQVCEGCAVADMIYLAVDLSNSGVGDYWDDVDKYIRNHAIEHQILDRSLVKEMTAAGAKHIIRPETETDNDVVERNIGSFVSCSEPTLIYGFWTICCNANLPVALYKAWENIIKCSNGTAHVNLLLNRQSKWMSIYSYLPYEGKVVLKNKSVKKLYLRMPLWVDKKTVKCKLNDRVISFEWHNNYIVMDHLKNGDTVCVEFPVAETTEKWTEKSYDTTYTCRFKGNTLIDISPRNFKPLWHHTNLDDGTFFPINKGYPIYRREHYKSTIAPIKTKRCYIPREIV